MKAIGILFFTIFFPILSFGQYIFEDSNQPDSVYRINKVKSKTLFHPNDRVSIKYSYDISGRLMEEVHLLRDTQMMDRKLMYYDSTGKLIKQYNEVFFKIDTSKKDIYFSPSDLDQLKPLTTYIGYNAAGELERKTTINFKKEKVSEEIFSINPLRRTEKMFHPKNSSYDSIIIEYERPNFINHIINYHIDNNETQKTSELTIANYFHKNGTIAKRIVSKLTANSTDKTKEEYYQYNSSGLLTGKTEKHFHNKKVSTKKLLIKYDYRD